MSYRVRYTKAARADLHRLYDFLLQHDLRAAKRARDSLKKPVGSLQHFPFSCRKATTDNPFPRALVIPFGEAGHVAFFEIEDNKTVAILAIRHQREDDYY